MWKTFFEVMAFATLKTLRSLCPVVVCIALFLAAVFVPIQLAFASGATSGWRIGICFGLYALEIWLFVTVRRAIKTIEYIREHNCSIEEAWEATGSTPDDGGDF